ncbi:hypothetical protein RZP48_01985 [Enterobacter asburiae]|uniref:Uncharacterized protein n=1 Tax=Enterobacter asburiae TaxID=61645 RepID=A0AAW7ZZH7_ENTAS|nr:MULTISPECIES: hypothetical protein [Enterobacter cloacae complex]KJW80113.1 hypothetical protein SG67_17280 [Enterobacter asburiae]KJX09685.1 hypothetical protein SG66_16475 [Enterobacter asburiae]MCL8161647.1 hypothetical protein [Enterobacter asburiae]MCM7939371.1 hypothetical protein [Enterobacter asburiae]MDO7925073.1 hypothetical protein [Enterobacter asburiae]
MPYLNMLASISADTSILKAKSQKLLEMFPEHIPDQLLCMISSLLSDIVFVDGPPAVSAGGAFNIVYALDFNTAAYSQVMAAARTLKINPTHE